MLERATRELDAQPDRFTCRRCQRSDQFVSHGFVYRKQRGGVRCVVGKRVFCANRCGRRGCGATLRLWLSDGVPRLHVAARVLQGFVLALLAGSGVASAYLQATAALSSRQGWRWVKRLRDGLVLWRSHLPRSTSPLWPLFAARSQRMQVLLTSLSALALHFGERFVARFQADLQVPFLR